MSERRAPQHFFDALASGDEATMANARQGVIEWLTAQSCHGGDFFTIPDPETGEEMTVRFDPSGRTH
jgi:hypothetical protein